MRDPETAQKRVIALTELLIATPSPNLPGDERAVAQVVRDALAERDLPLPATVAAHPSRPNLLVTLDFGPGGRHLCLSGHLDTKPVGTARWTTDPYTPTVVGDRLYGLGACDMKGAVAAMIEATATAAADPPPAGKLTLCFTADEEYSAAFGSRHLAEVGALEADAILIGEPGGIDADWDFLHVMSRGITLFRVEVEGDQGHSSLSSVRGFTSATQEMARLLVRFAERYQPSYPAHPSLDVTPTVNAGVLVEGGVNYGVVPGSASFAVDVRLIPGMEREAFVAELEQFLAEAQAERPHLRARVVFEDFPRDWLPPTEVAVDDPLVGACQAALAAVTGGTPPLGAFPGTTDAAWFQGHSGIPTLPACGPGLLERAHAADEYVSVKALGQAHDVYAHVIADYCAGQP